MSNLKILHYSETGCQNLAGLIEKAEIKTLSPAEGTKKLIYQAIEKKEYDLLVIDTDENTAIVYQMLENNQVPVILLTNGNNEKLLIKALDAGLNHYLLKDPENIYLRILPTVVKKACEEFARKQTDVIKLKKFVELFENSPFGIIFADTEGNIIDSNPVILSMAGAPSVTALSEFNLLNHAKLREIGFHEQFGQCVTEKKVITSETILNTIWNKKLYVRYYLKPVTDPVTNSTMVLVLIEDISDVKKAQEKILFQNSLLRQIPSAVFATDTDGQIIYWNKFSENLYGISTEEAMKSNINDILKDKSYPEIFPEILQAVAKNGYWENEINLFQKNREVLPIFCASVTIKNENSEVKGIVITSINISHIKSIEKALLESHKLYLTLARNLPNVAVLLFDKELRYKIAEGSAIDIKDLAKFEGKTIWEALPEDVSLSLEPYYRVTLLGKQISFERQFGERIYNIKMLPVKNEYNDIFAGMVVYNDITEQKQAEEKLKASLKEKEILLKEIHHRVKNNLQIISSLLNLQASYIKDKSILSHFVESQNRVKSMALIHEKLYKTGNLSRIDFSEYLRNLTSYLLQIYKFRDVPIRFELKVENTFLDIETAIPCGLIVNELVSNSLKYAFNNSKKEGVISVFLDYNNINTEFELNVKDNGKGFPDNIDFKNTSTLGLQLINSLVEQLEGTVELISKEGAEFKITFKEIRYKER